MIRVEEYLTEDGKSPFAKWFNSLNVQAAAKVTVYLTRIEEGNISSLKPLRGALCEVVINWGPGYRVYVGTDGSKLIILFGGSTKKRQQKSIEAAYLLWEEYKRRKKR